MSRAGIYLTFTIWIPPPPLIFFRYIVESNIVSMTRFEGICSAINSHFSWNLETSMATFIIPLAFLSGPLFGWGGGGGGGDIELGVANS